MTNTNGFGAEQSKGSEALEWISRSHSMLDFLAKHCYGTQPLDWGRKRAAAQHELETEDSPWLTHTNGKEVNHSLACSQMCKNKCTDAMTVTSLTSY